MEGESDKGLEEETYINGKKKVDISKAFSGSLSNKISILLEAIEEVDRLIELRKAVSNAIQESIGKDMSNSEFQLRQLKPWQLGNSQPIEMRRLGIEREILSLNKEVRSEEVRAWEHIASLLKLRRQFLIEYENLLATKKTLEGSAP
jgi:hypothetical protein